MTEIDISPGEQTTDRSVDAFAIIVSVFTQHLLISSLWIQENTMKMDNGSLMYNTF